MNLKALQEKVSLHGKRVSQYHLYTPEEKEILTMTVKLNEEVGELCNDILSILRLQRRAKLEKFDKRNVYQEFADVILTTLQLASAAKVDIERAVMDKIKKIEERTALEEKRAKKKE